MREICTEVQIGVSGCRVCEALVRTNLSFAASGAEMEGETLSYSRPLRLLDPRYAYPPSHGVTPKSPRVRRRVFKRSTQADIARRRRIAEWGYRLHLSVRATMRAIRAEVPELLEGHGNAYALCWEDREWVKAELAARMTREFIALGILPPGNEPVDH